VTEEEWLASDKPSSRVFALHSIGRERNFKRKFLLFTCACFRRGRDLPPSALRAAGVLESHADGEVDFSEVVALRKKHGQPSKPAGPLFTDGIGSDTSPWREPFWQYHASWQTASAISAAATVRKPGRPSRVAIAEREQTVAALQTLVNDIFGNPFRPVSFSPEWRTSTAVALARQMYDSRDFSAMPILADALQDAGCDNDDVLNHCRDPKQAHVRGCWVVDLVLGKE
jgi:hypothetical protein